MIDEAGVPVLTEVVDESIAAAAPGLTSATVEALARELERAVLVRLAPEIDRLMEERVVRTVSQALDGARAELRVSVEQTVREAVAASVARALTPQSERP